jgi:hypothetical protein
MAQCSNCKKNLSCGCQKKKASDGVSVCNNCIGTYEAKKSSQDPIKKVMNPEVSIIPRNSKRFPGLNNFIK